MRTRVMRDWVTLMKLRPGILALCSACWLAGNVSAGTTEGAVFIQELLEWEDTENVEFGKTVTIGDTLEFSIPSDWEELPEEEAEERCCFARRGTDEDGREVSFVGVEEMGSYYGVSYSSYADMKENYREGRYSYSATTLNGIDMVFLEDDNVAVGMCLMTNGDFFTFGFACEGNHQILEIQQSDKLKGDIAAILHSVKAINEERLMRFEGGIAPLSKTFE